MALRGKVLVQVIESMGSSPMYAIYVLFNWLLF